VTEKTAGMTLFRANHYIWIRLVEKKKCSLKMASVVGFLKRSHRRGAPMVRLSVRGTSVTSERRSMNLEMWIFFFQMTAHFVFNTMNSVLEMALLSW
jgi:hypothetical protein